MSLYQFLMPHFFLVLLHFFLLLILLDFLILILIELSNFFLIESLDILSHFFQPIISYIHEMVDFVKLLFFLNVEISQ
jgi:hypothetical protein